MSETKRWPGEDDNPRPDVFTTAPPYPETLKYGQLSRDQFNQFFEQGYVLIEKFFEGDELKVLEDCKEGIKKEVNTIAQKLYKAGKIKNLYEEYGLFQRLILIDKEYPGANILLHKQGVLPDFFRPLWSHPKLLNVVEQLLGTADINGDPNWNLRVKTPKTDAATVPWHQDNGYGAKEQYYQMVLTGWVPFLDTNENNGCMQVVKTGHKRGKVAKHTGCWKDTWYLMLDEEEMTNTLGVNMEEDVVTCRVPYGGILLFSNMLPHRSLNNNSKDIRWSIDIRWVNGQSTGEYFGLKKAVKLRSAADPNMKIDWDEFAEIDRHSIVGTNQDELDTILFGPWMTKWEMVNTNRHTDEFFKHEKEGGPAAP